jgi:dUTP pyrophosphatase
VSHELRIRRLRPDASIPAYQTEGAAGLDLSAALDKPITIAPGDRALVMTGIAIALPRGHEGQVRPRSGLALKHGVTVLNSPGTIDEDYRGEIGIVLVNHGKERFHVTHGMRIAQLVVAPVRQVEVREVTALDDTARGSGGYGSTGG